MCSPFVQINGITTEWNCSLCFAWPAVHARFGRAGLVIIFAAMPDCADIQTRNTKVVGSDQTDGKGISSTLVPIYVIITTL